jgi:DNA-binding transcriptional regulator YhcF (GntR family)
MTANGNGLPKYARVAAAVRGQIADGALRPGQPAPSGAALSRLTGFSTLTCRKALRLLIAEGALTPGPSRNARPRVAGPPQPPAERDLAMAARDLATGLAARRRARGLTQPELAVRAGVSVTTVGHAETGRLWQSRDFWERADAVLGAGGALLRLHDAYQEASAASPAGAPAAPAGRAGPAAPPGAAAPGGAAARTPAAGQSGPAGEGGPPIPGPPPPEPAPAPGQGESPHPTQAPRAGGFPPPSPGGPCAPPAPRRAAPACVMIVWGDGTVTTVRPPEATLAGARPAEALAPDAP